MLCGSRVMLTRPAVAFFNMKHFQAKKKYNLTPQNTHETLSTVLSPRDRLLRQSVSGSGGARVLVLDAQQKVKGVYLPVFCMPHPSTFSTGGNSLGVPVADYTHFIDGMSATRKASGGDSAPALPSVLVVMSHPEGVAYGTFRADGTPGVPMKNLKLPPTLQDVTIQKEATSVVSSMLRNSGLGTVMPMLNAASGTRTVLSELYQEFNEGEHAAELSACCTFLWVQRESRSLTSLEAARSFERNCERMQSAGEGAFALATGGVSFLDRRWIFLMDAALRPETGLGLYARDSATGDRIVNATGVQSALSRGALLLDYVPRSVVDGTGAEKSSTAVGG
ncbi:hypothetical protein LSCM1_00121 [Leishmania martiniquensis]|uniref:Uncharacterized protein n=1 Tax=Leishmania martiniquensis TaxID=1580590 RepID=A0A836FJY3_9TRYP|nr:hypothetical protein LSCM1_00121 [Leishmania martiniquensis]